MPRLIIWFLSALVTLCLVACGGNGGGHTTPPTNTWSITPAGGTFNAGSGTCALTVPAGAVAANTTVTATKLATNPTPPAGTTFVANSGWSFTHTTFANPATLKMTFAADAVPTAGLATLKLYRREDGQTNWTPVPTTVDAGAHTATASVNGFSSYALFYGAGTGWNWTSAAGEFTFENLTAILTANVVSAPVEVQPRRTPTPFTPPTGWAAVANTTFDLGSSNPDLHTEHNFTIRIAYAAADVPVDQRPGAKIFYKENEAAAWVPLATNSIVDHLYAEATNNALGTFALFIPTPATRNLYYVEITNIAGTNDNNLDVYSVDAAGETHPYHAVMDHDHRLIPETFRMDGGTNFLQVKSNGISEVGIFWYDPTTNISSFVHDISPADRWEYESIIPMRSTRVGSTSDTVVYTQEFNENDMQSRDRLTLYRTGQAPKILVENSRDPSGTPAIYRGMDINAAGDVLAWTPEGLVIFEGDTHRVLVSETIPAQARFSPDGTKVLYAHIGPGNFSWNTVPTAGGTPTPIAGLTNEDLARWNDDGSVLVSTSTNRALRHLDLSTGVFTSLGSAPTRPGSIIDLGPRL